MVRAQFNLASSPEGSDAETGQLTDRGQQAIIEVAQAWERYLRLKPKKIDASAAAFAALAYGALQDYDKAVETQQLSVEGAPERERLLPAGRLRLPRGPGRDGRRAAEEAVRRTPRDQRNTVRSLIKDTKKQGARDREGAGGGQEGRSARQRKQGQDGRAPSPARASARCPGQARPAAAAPRRSARSTPHARTYNRRRYHAGSRAVSSTGRAGDS